MVLTKTPICNFGEKPYSFELKGVDNNFHKFEDSVRKKWNFDYVYLQSLSLC